MIRVGSKTATRKSPRRRSRREAATLRRDGSFAVGRAGRDVHAPLQHRAHRRDARGIPRHPARAWRRTGQPDRRRPVLGDVLPRGARPQPALRHPVRPAGPPPGDALRSGLRGRRGHPHRPDHEPAHPRRDPLAGGRVDGRERPVDPGLHRDGHGRQRAAPRPGVGPLRGRDAARSRRRIRRRADPVRRASVRRRSSSTPSCMAARSSSSGRVKDPAGEAASVAAPHVGLSRYGGVAAELARLAAGPDLDRGERLDRPVVQPVDLPVRQGRPALPRPGR